MYNGMNGIFQVGTQYSQMDYLQLGEEYYV